MDLTETFVGRQDIFDGRIVKLHVDTVTLPDGNYTIGVQAVDGRRQGSPFCTCQFAMEGGTATAVRSITRQEADTHYIYNIGGQQVNSPARSGKKQILVRKGRKTLY